MIVTLDANATTTGKIAKKTAAIRMHTFNAIQSLILIPFLMMTISCDRFDNSQAKGAIGTQTSTSINSSVTTATGTNTQLQADKETDGKFVGIWKNEGSYLEIRSDNSFATFECSTNQTYKKADEGTISSNGTLNVDSITVSLSVANNLLTATFSDPDFTPIEYKKVSSVPESCKEDAIEITAVTPANATQGVSTEFTVTFDYTLISADLGMIQLGFNVDDKSGFTMTDSKLEVTKGSGSGSLKAKVAPKFYQSGKFQAYVNIFKRGAEVGPYSPYASSQRAIEVRPSNSLNIHDNEENDLFSSQGYCLQFQSCKSH